MAYPTESTFGYSGNMEGKQSLVDHIYYQYVSSNNEYAVDELSGTIEKLQKELNN